MLEDHIKVPIYETLDFFAEKYRVHDRISEKECIDHRVYEYLGTMMEYHSIPRLEVIKMLDYYNKHKI